MRGLMGDTKVAQGLKTLSLAVAQDQKLISLLREAGTPLPDK
jgi:hypothetical protein